jgi:hypothetical protein
MKIRILATGIALLLAVPVLAGLAPELAPLEPFVGKTYVGQFTDTASGQELTDVQSWEAILGGKAIRTVHSLNDGAYGGETIIWWDAKAGTLAYFYVTTAGFVTRGTMEASEGVFTAHEAVEGSADGITEVKSTSRVLADGSMLLASEYLKDGAWVPGHEISYTENSDAEVKF